MTHTDVEKFRAGLREHLITRVEEEGRDLAQARIELATASITAGNDELNRLVRYTFITLSLLSTYEEMLAALDSEDPPAAMFAAARNATHPQMVALALSAAQTLATAREMADAETATETVRTIDTAEAAEQLRRALHDAFPTTEFTVTENPPARAQLRISWSEGPTRDAVIEAAKSFLGLASHGEQDWTSNESQMVVTAAGELPELVRYHVGSLATTRTHRDATMRAVATKLIAQNPDLFAGRPAPDADALTSRELGDALKLVGRPDDVIVLDGLPVHAPGPTLADALAHTLRHTDMTGAAERRQKEN